MMNRTGLTLGLCVLALAAPSEVRAANPVIFTNAAEIHRLSREAAGSGFAVKLDGVVTYSDPLWNLLFVRDASAGIFVSLPGGNYPTNTELVEIAGHTSDGSFLPVVVASSWRHLGVGEMPAPRRITQPERFASEIDSEWSELVGVVRQVELNADQDHVQIDLSDGNWRARVFLPAAYHSYPAGLQQLVDSKIRVVGVLGVDYANSPGAISLKAFVAGPAFLQVLEKPAADPFQLPLVSLARLGSLSGTNIPVHRIHLRGRVTCQAPGELFLQENNGALRVRVPPPARFKPGDTLEAVGFLCPGMFAPLLEDASLRALPLDLAVQPVSVAPGAVLWGNYDGRLVQLTGSLQNHEVLGTNRILTLFQDGVVFGAVLDARARGRWPQLQNGDRLRVTGVCVVQGTGRARPQSFQILLRSPADVVQVSPMLQFSARQVLLGLAAAAGAWGLVLLWGVLLRRKVREQTRELAESLSLLNADITARKAAEAQLATVHHQLLETSRRVGMAEVASAVLHNVGNVLNSVNVSATLVNDRLRRTRADHLAQAALLLGTRMDDLDQFLSLDPKGQKLRGYLKDLGATLLRENEELQAEVESLRHNVEHIKTIVARQQNYAQVSGTLEDLDPRELMESAFQINCAAYERERIRVTRDYHPAPAVLVDRHKALQVLVNLFTNAREALEQTAPPERQVSLGLFCRDSHHVCLTVRDNGVGITAENLSRIFSQGFTTRKDGHGFGLHSGAIAAREMNGCLSVHSDGPTKGALFTLQLPVSPPQPAPP